MDLRARMVAEESACEVEERRSRVLRRWGGNLRWGAAGLVCLAVMAACVDRAPPPAASFDLVIAGGRVIDPETGLDALRDVGIIGGSIAEVSDRDLTGKVEVDATGLVVAPGFIDLHSHAMNTPSAWMQAFDGVTTALELEAGAYPVKDAYAAAEAAGRPINYGYSVSWRDARRSVMGERWQTLAGPAEQAETLKRLEEGLLEGALGIGLLVGYAPDSNREEYIGAARLAARYKAPTFTHVRFKNTHEPMSVLEGVSEVIAVAAATGAHMHICHINSSALRATPMVRALIERAQASGAPISTEGYPWGAGSTRISAPFLKPENLHLLDIEPADIEYLTTGERPATAERLGELQRTDPDGEVIIRYLDESDPADSQIIADGLLIPNGMFASDAIAYTVDGRTLLDEVWPLPPNAVAHPRVAATFSTILGDYVRERRLLSLPEAIRRSTLLPADLLAMTAPAMRSKGRIQIGADADIVVFDPDAIAGRATYASPATPAAGMRQVIVGGTFVIRDGELQVDARPGRAVRGAASANMDGEPSGKK
jgi:N-acyl-D-glutamate deacylase